MSGDLSFDEVFAGACVVGVRRDPQPQPTVLENSPPMDLILQDALEQEELAEKAAEQVAQSKPATMQDLSKLAEDMVFHKEEKERLEAESKVHADRYNQIRNVELPQAMRAAGIVMSNGKGSFTFSGGKVHLETKVSASCTKVNQPTFFDWARKNGAQDLISETVNAQTLSAFIRERRGDGLSDPPGVAVFEQVQAKFTPAK